MKNAWIQAYRCVYTLSAVALVSIGSFSFAGAAEPDRNVIYQQAREHLRQEHPAQAYELLSQYEIEWAGDDAYDYLLGIAALDSGEAGEAIFSLQRLVARKPDFAGARMDLARAYYDIGDNELARVEFQRILTENPPIQVENAANEYMKAIDTRARKYSASTQYYFNLEFGHDSNAPAATDEQLFLSFRLSDNNLEQSSAFTQVAFGATHSRPLSAESQLLLNVGADHRRNPSAGFVDASNIDLGIGWNWKGGRNQVTVAANSRFSALENQYNKRDLGVTASYMRKLNDTWSISGFVRTGGIRFEQSLLEIRDVDQVKYGVTMSHTFSSSMLHVALTGSIDDARNSGSPFSTDGYGILVSDSWFRPGGKVYFVEVGANTVDFDDPFFGFSREDDIYLFSLGASWSNFPGSDWVTTFRINYSKKDSTVSLYQFDRLEVGLSLRKVF